MKRDPESENFGRSMEDFIEKICTNAFFADFTIRSPKYLKKDGKEKEAADVFVLLGDTLLVIQVKTRQVGVDDVDQLTDVEMARFTKTIDKTISQFKALIEAWGDPSFGEFVNGRGERVDLKKGSLKRVTLLAIYAALDATGNLAPINLRCNESCLAEEAIHLHLFSVAEFRTLLGLTGTISDFIHYLELRAFLHHHKIISNRANPIELWAFVRFEETLLRQVLDSHNPVEVDGMMDKHHNAILQLETSEQSSYFVDSLIEDLHQGIKAKLDEHETIVESTYQMAIPGSLGAYQMAIPYLAKLTRAERGRITDELFERVRRSQVRGLSSGGIRFPAHDEAYLVLAQPGPRKERQPTMLALSKALMKEFNCKKVVCLATGPEGPLRAGCDVMVVQKDLWESSGTRLRM